MSIYSTIFRSCSWSISNYQLEDHRIKLLVQFGVHNVLEGVGPLKFCRPSATNHPRHLPQEVVVFIFYHHWTRYMPRKVYLTELEGCWLGGRRNITQFKRYLAFSSIMSMLQNFVLTKFQIILTCKATAVRKLRGAHLLLCHVWRRFCFNCHKKWWSHLIVDNDQIDRKIAPHLLSLCGLIGDTAITLPKIVIKSIIRFS